MKFLLLIFCLSAFVALNSNAFAEKGDLNEKCFNHCKDNEHQSDNVCRNLCSQHYKDACQKCLNNNCRASCSKGGQQACHSCIKAQETCINKNCPRS